MSLTSLLDSCDSHVRDELAKMPEVKDVESFDPASHATPIVARRWLRVSNVVAVVADLKSSTKLGIGRNARSTASIYEAALNPTIDILYRFDAGSIPVQGDAVIGVFWGDAATERAMCAGITIKTFSERHLVERLTQKWPQLPGTGFRVGIASSPVLVKRVGRAATDHQALVWAGKAVNYAAKAAQSGDTGQLIVAGSVWDAIECNDYMTFTCDCSRLSPSLWRDHDISQLDHDSIERSGRCLTSSWCKTCGERFCDLIIAGNTRRDEVDDHRSELQRSLFKDAIAKKNASERRNRRHLRQAYSGQ